MNYKRRKNKKPAILLVTAALTMGIIESCSRGEAANNNKELTNKTAETSQAFKAVPISYMNPEYQISVPGELEPYEEVAVHAKVKGFVKHLYVDRGDRVREGQLLAVLEAPEMNKKYLSDKSTQQKVYSDYMFAKQTYQRLLEASKTEGAVAPIELEKAKNAMQSALSAYKAAKAKTGFSSQMRHYLHITAPFGGIITDRNVSVGALVGADVKPLFRMAEKAHLRLTVSVPGKHAKSVWRGMKATFTVSSLPEKAFTARLSRTSELIDQQSNSLTLEFDVDNSSGTLNGGEYAQVRLNLKRSDSTFWVSYKNILRTQSGLYVLTLNNGEIKRIPVKEGVRIDTLTEVFGNLNKRDSIILNPNEQMK